MANVNVIYHHFPHYRAPVLRALTRSSAHHYRFWAGQNDFAGIRAFRGDAEVQIKPLDFHGDEATGRMRLSGYGPAVADRSAQAVIVIGNPNIRATWTMALWSRLTGKKVLFWAHGWLKPESWGKARLRNVYFRLAHRVLVYGERAVQLAQRSGFPADRVRVIYNSLDWEAMQPAGDQAQAIPRDILRREYGLDPHARILLCTARLTQLCEFPVLLHAAARLRQQGENYQVMLVGDGPERQSLENLSRELSLTTVFAGAVYHEETLARLYRLADVTVSPGKVGLTAIHSLTYGVPVITHGDMDAQMPEVEAIEPGRSGAFFVKGDADSLAQAIDDWFTSRPDSAAVGAACRDRITSRYRPDVQASLIDAAVSEVLSEP